MSELETRVRDALRADEIGWDDLRQPTLRVAPRAPRRWPTTLAIAAAVVMVATVASVIAVISGNGSTAPAGAPAAYAGYTWRVTAVTDRRGPIRDAVSVPVQIAFSETAVSATLHNASIFGHYQATSHGYHLTDLGIAGRPTSKSMSRTETRVGEALGHMFINSHASLASSNLASVTAQVSGHQLVLRANGVTMRLSREGPSRLSPMIDAVGYRWGVEAATDAHGQLMMPHRSHVKLGFDSSGVLLANDGVNRIVAQLGLSGDGYVVRSSRSGNGYVWHDRTVLRLKAAVDAMVANQAAVTATLDGDTLTLSRGAITLTLHRGARMRDTGVAVRGSGASTAPAPTTNPVRHARGAGGSHH